MPHHAGICHSMLAQPLTGARRRAGAGLVNPWAAAVIGAVGGLFCVQTSELMIKYKLDDVVNAVAIHLSPGVWGVISVGFFARPDNIRHAYTIPMCAFLFCVRR